jgi:hypothetical protein
MRRRSLADGRQRRFEIVAETRRSPVGGIAVAGPRLEPPKLEAHGARLFRPALEISLLALGGAVVSLVWNNGHQLFGLDTSQDRQN